MGAVPARRTHSLPPIDLESEAIPETADPTAALEVTEYLPEETVPADLNTATSADPGKFLAALSQPEPASVEIAASEISPVTPPEPPASPPVPKSLVLVGAGKAHLLLLGDWMRRPLPNVRLKLISAFEHATFSPRIAPALAEIVSQPETAIALPELCKRCDCELIVDRVNGIDPAQRTLQLAHHPDVSFDWASLNMGTVPVNEPLWQARRMMVSIAPRPTFLARFEARFQELLAQYRAAPSKRKFLQIVVVGGDALGVELSLCLEERINNHDLPCEVLLVTSAPDVLKDALPWTRKGLKKLFHQRGIHVHPGKTVVDYDDQGAANLQLQDGSTLPADLVIWAEGIAPPAVIKGFSLPKSDEGFPLVTAALQTTSLAPVFILGNTAVREGQLRPTAGWSSIDQYSVFRENLDRAFREQPLVAYQRTGKPSLWISCGDEVAIFDNGRFSFRNSWVAWIKSILEQRLLRKIQRPGRRPAAT